MKKSFLLLLSITFLISCATTQPQYKPLPAQSQLPQTVAPKPFEDKDKEKIKQLESKIEKLEKKIKELEMKREKENLSSKEKDILLKQLTMLSIEQRKNMEYLRKITAEISSIKKEKKEKIRKPKKYNIKTTNRVPTKKIQNKKKKKNIKIAEDTLYITCYKMYLKKQYKNSETCFNKFIAKYPKSHLTSNAYFWIGETYFARANFPKAIDYYDIILTKFPQSRKVPSALLKEGLAFYELNDNEGAKIFLEKIIHDYPNTKQAEYAKKYLEKYKLNR